MIDRRTWLSALLAAPLAALVPWARDDRAYLQHLIDRGVPIPHGVYTLRTPLDISARPGRRLVSVGVVYRQATGGLGAVFDAVPSPCEYEINHCVFWGGQEPVESKYLRWARKVHARRMRTGRA